MSKYNIHSDFKKYENTKLPLYPLLLPLINTLINSSVNKIKPAEGVSATKKKITGYQNGTIELTIYEPKEIEKNAPCLIYLHGGAFALKAAPYHKNLVCEYALKTPCKVIFVDYRLAPKYAFPFGVEDCYAAFEWVCKNVEVLGIDKNRIAIGGDSAGGGLAAAVNLMARDRKAPSICFQMLIYPVTDARQITESIKNYIDTPMWNSKLNEKMWKLYLKDEVHINREYASPMEATSLENLPDSYIEVSEFDCLRDEGINFAEALQKNGIHVELHKTIGTVHGFDIAEKSEIVHQSVERRIEALKKGFNPVDNSDNLSTR
ncbi:alpha/beta hydrolase [Clostridium estertheticum]|uniref:alpha/beta hydrolase n=1 Tax=Clostridium estertheticum TaxID=238834 RepID=UPI001C0C8C32|nr:alpha/beta hydrolase [Clostridium estertheticum]MBU3178347.1 alpha/beta hydrolase [Clostridium estertheticum]